MTYHSYRYRTKMLIAYQAYNNTSLYCFVSILELFLTLESLVRYKVHLMLPCFQFLAGKLLTIYGGELSMLRIKQNMNKNLISLATY